MPDAAIAPGTTYRHGGRTFRVVAVTPLHAWGELRDARKVLWRDVLLTELRQKWQRVEDAPAAPRLRRARVEG